ncbi:hypothetical protein CO86_2496 [Staphylococcus aureus subsp. aureus CO-86]|nr:hypothetical protein CO86_2496 [Staphylococcus aureus subsp. aureus CO-86]WRM56681.1 hypothetical protein UM546_11425 [Staphylococcus aureus]
MVKSIFLQDGEEIFVDDEDYERVNQYIWTKSYVDNVRRIHTKTLNVSLSGFVLENGFQKIKIMILPKTTSLQLVINNDGQGLQEILRVSIKVFI